MADIAKVKRNIKRMIDQNAPETDIDAYVASEGVSLEELRAPSREMQQGMAEISAALPSTPVMDARSRQYENLPGYLKPLVAADDMASLFAEGATQGLVSRGVSHLRSKFTGKSYEDERKAINAKLDDARKRAGSAGLVAEIGGAVALPAKLASAGITATRIPKVGGLLGLTADGAVLGAANAYGHDEDIGQGALLGGALGAGGQVLANLGGKLISPFMASPERTKAVKALKREGVDVTAGQATGSKKLRYAESELGGAAAQDIAEQQGEQFTAAALRRTGTQAPRATPDVIDNAFTRIGNEFDTLSARNQIVADPQVAQDLTQVAVDYGSVVAPSFRAPVVEKSINDVLALLRGQGRMDGKAYKTFRSQLADKARKATDPYLKGALNDLVETLDDAMERSIARYNPADQGAWSQARKQYRNMLVIERAATGAGENAAVGLISPAQLRNATTTKHGRRNYARGRGDFAELARSGQAVMQELPQSGTAPRLASRGIPQILSSIVGASQGDQFGGGVQGAILGAGTGFAAPYLLGRAMLSGPGQKYLGNQAMGKVSKQTKQAIARALATGGISSGLLGNQ